MRKLKLYLNRKTKTIRFRISHVDRSPSKNAKMSQQHPTYSTAITQTP